MRNMPHFAILMSTHNRPLEVLRAVRSVRNQTYPHWNCYIVVDDPKTNYGELLTLSGQDERIVILQNGENLGKNRSVNRILDRLSSDSFGGYILFLDDDDWLSESCLADFAKLIHTQARVWLVSNRTETLSNKAITRNPHNLHSIHYLRDMLLLRRFWGDATHCILFPAISDIRFPALIKNAEEWLYFAHIAKRNPYFYYTDVPGTYTKGYSREGLTFLSPPFKERVLQFKQVLREIHARHLHNIYVYAYMCGKLIKLLLTRRGAVRWSDTGLRE